MDEGATAGDPYRGGLIRAGLLDEKSKEDVRVFATANHFVFGAAGGAFYALLRWVAPIPATVPMGIAFGLGIWASSYRGWIPAMNILPAEQLPGRRGTLVMIAAHAVYGATLGALSRRALRDVSDRDELGSRYGSAAGLTSGD